RGVVEERGRAGAGIEVLDDPLPEGEEAAAEAVIAAIPVAHLETPSLPSTIALCSALRKGADHAPRTDHAPDGIRAAIRRIVPGHIGIAVEIRRPRIDALRDREVDEVAIRNGHVGRIPLV